MEDYEINNLNKQVANLKEQIHSLKSAVNQQKTANELLTQNNKHITQQLLNVQEELNSQTTKLEAVSQECDSYKSQLKTYEDNTLQMLADVNKTWYKRVKSVTSQKTNLVEENEKLVAEIISLKKELATENRPLENAKKKFERIINQNYQFFEDMTNEQNEKIKYEVQIKNQLVAEVKRLNKEIRYKDDTILAMKRKIKILQIKNFGLKSRMEEINTLTNRRCSKVPYNKQRSMGMKMNFHRQIDLYENVCKYGNISEATVTQTKLTNISMNNSGLPESNLPFEGLISPIAFSVRIKNIAADVRVRDLKVALRERGIMPRDITWKGYKGTAVLHFSATSKKMQSNSVDEIINTLEGLSLKQEPLSDAQPLIIEEARSMDDTYNF